MTALAWWILLEASIVCGSGVMMEITCGGGFMVRRTYL
jgi:hypothetical protein